ncbi:MAG: DUF1254 domain-containing protein [Planctomycetaceae bacterium]|nr:DUF1254 domain-containing protein [Planctomycetaceae bacterium]
MNDERKRVETAQCPAFPCRACRAGRRRIGNAENDGLKPDGSKKYTLRFEPGQLPPVNAFWSMTMYRMPEILHVDNPIDRYLLNAPILDQFKRDADGGLTLYFQHELPGEDKESNWLPAPEGWFMVVMRLYWPKQEALNGTWTPPQLQRVK